MSGSPYEERVEIWGVRTGESLYHLLKNTKTFTLTGAKVVDYWYGQIEKFWKIHTL